MTGKIRVDPAALRQLGADLVHLADQLNTNADGLGTGVTDPLLCMALKDVEHDWSKKRKLITGYLTNAGKAAQAAADGYQQTEDAIVCTATPGAQR